jgi:hypothetical protein
MHSSTVRFPFTHGNSKTNLPAHAISLEVTHCVQVPRSPIYNPVTGLRFRRLFKTLSIILPLGIDNSSIIRYILYEPQK